MKIPQKIITARIKGVHKDIREVLSDLEAAGSGSVEMFLHDALRHYLSHTEGINAAIKYGSSYAKEMKAVVVAVAAPAPEKIDSVDEPPRPRPKTADELMASVINRINREDDSLEG